MFDKTTPSTTPGAARPGWLRAAAIVGMLAWAFGVGAAAQYVWHYQSTPGTSGAAPKAWLGSTLVTRVGGEPTLIMFVHPLCTCSRASLAELNGILENAKAPISAWVLFLRPNGTSDDWANTPSWEAARNIPGVHVLVDREGVEAKRFGASTSGHVVLYDGDGELRFVGGITGARGHVGANSGAQSVAAYASGAEGEVHEHAVFGCGFHDLAEKQRKAGG